MKQQYLRLLSALEESAYKTSMEIAEQLMLSNKTVQKLLKELDEILSGNGACIEVKHRTDFRLCVENQSSFKKCLERRSEMLPSNAEERVYFILKKLVVTSGYLRMSDLEEELYVSRNTLSGCLKQVEEELQKYNLSIERRSKYGFRLQGHEMDKRRFVTAYFKKLDVLSAKTEEDMIQQLSHCIRNSLRAQNFSISDFALRNLITHLYVAIERIKSDQYISGDMLNIKELQSQEEYAIAQQLVYDMESKLELQFPEPEIAYITIHLAGKKMQEQSKVNNVVINQRISDIVDEMLEEVYRQIYFDFRNDLELKMALCQHLIALETRAKYHMELKNPLLEEVRSSYPMAYTIALEAAVVLNKRFNTRLSEHEVGYIAFSFALAQEREETSVEKKNILLVCATGKGSAKLLQYKYEKEFGEHINQPRCCDATELDEVDFANIDYVITTVPISINIPRPILEVEYFLDQKEISNLRATLFAEAKSQEIMDFYCRDLFIPHLKAKDRDEIIDNMCEHIHKHRKIPKDFCRLIKKREAMAKTEFGNLVAMPHPDKNIVDRTFVCIAVLEHPILWEEKRVQVVFLVAVERELKKSIQFFYQVTAEFLLSSECINGLIKHRSFDWFEQKIKQL